MEKSQQAELVNEIVKRVRQWGIVDLVSILLAGIRPIAFIGGQALWVMQPALGVLMDGERVARYARLLEQPEALEMLSARLEES